MSNTCRCLGCGELFDQILLITFEDGGIDGDTEESASPCCQDYYEEIRE